MHPKLKFKISAQKDIDTIYAFSREAEYNNGRTLEWAIFKKHPSLRRSFKKYEITDSNGISGFIKEKYKKEQVAIKSNLKKYEKNWAKDEKIFFELTKELFSSFSWPKGKYIAYPTIWGMFPRFLEDKTFQIPYSHRNKKYINVVIAHEMLHFIFYEYFYSNYPKYKDDKYNFFVWNISETFNEIIQNSPKWIRIFKVKTMGYPEHRKIVRKLAKKYYKHNIIELDQIINDIIKEVKKMKINY